MNRPAVLPDRRTEFEARAQALGSQIVHATTADLLSAVEGLLLPDVSVGVTEELLGREPSLHSLLRGDDRWPQVAVTAGEFAIAATGEVAVAPTTYRDRLLGILSRHQIIVLPGDALVPDLAAAAAILNGWFRSRERRYVTFVAGPSRTSDIERVLTRGVHGPEHVTLIFVYQEMPRGD